MIQGSHDKTLHRDRLLSDLHGYAMSCDPLLLGSIPVPPELLITITNMVTSALMVRNPSPTTQLCTYINPLRRHCTDINSLWRLQAQTGCGMTTVESIMTIEADSTLPYPTGTGAVTPSNALITWPLSSTRSHTQKFVDYRSSNEPMLARVYEKLTSLALGQQAKRTDVHTEKAHYVKTVVDLPQEQREIPLEVRRRQVASVDDLLDRSYELESAFDLCVDQHDALPECIDPSSKTFETKANEPEGCDAPQLHHLSHLRRWREIARCSEWDSAYGIVPGNFSKITSEQFLQPADRYIDSIVAMSSRRTIGGFIKPVFLHRPTTKRSTAGFAGLGGSWPKDQGIDYLKMFAPDKPVRVNSPLSYTEFTWPSEQVWKHFDGTRSCTPDDIDEPLSLLNLNMAENDVLNRLYRPPDMVQHDWLRRYASVIVDYGPHHFVQICDAGAFTDFHVDSCGSTVFFHVIKGKKTVLFIEPTEANLKKCYQSEKALDKGGLADVKGDVGAIYRVVLRTGESMILPGGWIHAVYTHEQTTVWSGNILHDFDIAMQIRVWKLEIEHGLRSQTVNCFTHRLSIYQTSTPDIDKATTFSMSRPRDSTSESSELPRQSKRIRLHSPDASASVAKTSDPNEISKQQAGAASNDVGVGMSGPETSSQDQNKRHQETTQSRLGHEKENERQQRDEYQQHDEGHPPGHQSILKDGLYADLAGQLFPPDLDVRPTVSVWEELRLAQDLILTVQEGVKLPLTDPYREETLRRLNAAFMSLEEIQVMAMRNSGPVSQADVQGPST
ncbi:hypothetical protein IAU59_007586 [Kwoniella sp. CBS 9459]